MYLWNVDRLIEDLKSNQVSQQEQFKYALAFSILTILATDPILTAGIEYSLMDFVSSVTMLAITVCGLFICYRANKRADDRDFILRLCTMGLPVSIRFLVVALPIVIVSAFLEAVLDPAYDIEDGQAPTTLYQVVVIAFFLILFYIYFASKFKRFAPDYRS